MPKAVRMTALVALLAAIPVLAQGAGDRLLDSILQATRLPTVTREARVLGVPETDVKVVFATAREHHLSAGDLAGLLAEENDAVRRHGPVENFGAFVQQKLSEGLRGRELAAAIHAEHAARGMGQGRPPKAGKPDERPGGPGSVAKPGKADEHGGKPAGRGKGAEKPESPGKSGQPGKKGGAR